MPFSLKPAFWQSILLKFFEGVRMAFSLLLKHDAMQIKTGLTIQKAPALPSPVVGEQRSNKEMIMAIYLEYDGLG